MIYITTIHQFRYKKRHGNDVHLDWNHAKIHSNINVDRPGSRSRRSKSWAQKYSCRIEWNFSWAKAV